MMKDIQFKVGETMFNCRAVGICIKDNKIILSKKKTDEYWAIVGGKVELGESTDSAVIREYQEEIGVTLQADHLVALIENFFELEGKEWHQFIFFYQLKDINNELEIFEGEKEAIDDKDVIYAWFDLSDLQNVQIKPDCAIEIIRDTSKNIRHIINQEIVHKEQKSDNEPTKIFTFGSCVSRDVFNHTKEEDFFVSLNIQRMSYALMPLEGYPVNYEDIDMEYLDDFPWEVKMMVTEISKKCLEMAKQTDAEYLVMDLIEERFDFAEFELEGKKYSCVKTGHFDNFYNKYLKEKVVNYRELSIDDYTDEEVRECFRQSISEIMMVFSIDRIILIETYYAEKMIDDNGQISEYEDKQEIKHINKRLHRLYTIMKQVLNEYAKDNKKYYLIAPEKLIGYANHKWGPFPAHYTDDFYVEIGRKIKEYIDVKTF